MAKPGPINKIASTVRNHDNISLVFHGDVFQVYYNADPTLSRTRWIFDEAESIIKSIGRDNTSFIAHIIVSSTAAPPEIDVRIEQEKRLKKLNVRLLVITHLGDDFQHMLARAIVRGWSMLQKQKITIVKSIDLGLQDIVRNKTEYTPSILEMYKDVNNLFQ